MSHDKCDAFKALVDKLGHDVANQLSIITGYTDLLLSSDNLDDTQTHKLRHIMLSAMKIRNLLSQSIGESKIVIDSIDTPE